MKLIKVYAEWCGPCKVLEKMLTDNKIDHTSINIDTPEGEEFTEKYKVRNIPVLIKIQDNVEIDRFTGIPSLEQLKEFIK